VTGMLRWVIQYRLLVVWLAVTALMITSFYVMSSLGIHFVPTGNCVSLGDPSMTGAGC
jgi:Cu/Ag efflux pump CusA